MSTYNPEISNIVKEEGGNVVYSAGNVLIVSEISEELYRELLKSNYIDSIEVLPLKRYGVTQKNDVPTITVNDTTIAFDDLEEEDDDDSENQQGSSTIG